MAHEDVHDLDALAQEFMESGLLKFRLQAAFLPVTGPNHGRRRRFGLD